MTEPRSKLLYNTWLLSKWRNYRAMKCKIVHCISDNIASDFYRLQLMGTESVKYENGFSKSP